MDYVEKQHSEGDDRAHGYSEVEIHGIKVAHLFF